MATDPLTLDAPLADSDCYAQAKAPMQSNALAPFLEPEIRLLGHLDGNGEEPAGSAEIASISLTGGTRRVGTGYRSSDPVANSSAQSPLAMDVSRRPAA